MRVLPKERGFCCTQTYQWNANTAPNYLFSNISCWNCATQLSFQAPSADTFYPENFAVIKKHYIVLACWLWSISDGKHAVKSSLFPSFVCLEVNWFFAWEKLTVKLSLVGIKMTSSLVKRKPHRFLHKSNSSQLKVNSGLSLHTFLDQSASLLRGDTHSSLLSLSLLLVKEIMLSLSSFHLERKNVLAWFQFQLYSMAPNWRSKTISSLECSL